MPLAPLLALVIAAAPAPTQARLDSLSAALPPVRAMRLSAPVTIDGDLSEEIWRTAAPSTDFKQLDPNEGSPPSERTEVRIGYDDDAIYVGARMYDSVPDSIMARLARRDVDITSDRFAVYLDPCHDRRSGYYFRVNAAGTLYDGTISNDGWTDSSWDGVWLGRVKRDGQGWTAEMRIPFSQLRYENGGSVWGVNFSRNIQRKNEGVYLVYQPKNGSGFVSRFPHLEGLERLPSSRSFELMPYFTTKGEFLSHADGDPFNDGSRGTVDAGGDLRMSVGSKLTLNATVNPDFGQVEVDPAVVNLSAYETFFPEKRPFFVENSSIFRFGNEGANNYWGFNWPEPTFFYSRRIGRAPQGGAPSIDNPDTQFAFVPSGTTIVGAAKLTGKLSPTWNFGTLHAMTDKEEAKWFETGSGDARFLVEPRTYYGVMRAQKEFARRQYGLGFMTTAAIRNIENSRLEHTLNRQSLMGGIDGWAFLGKDQTWVLSGWSVASHIEGTPERMLDVQNSSRHWFQRPDADHIEVDPNLATMTGHGSRVWLNKQKGKWFSNSALGYMTPEMDVNDIGFQSQSDIINGHTGWGYKWTEATRRRKYQEVLGALFASYDFQGNPLWGGVFLEGNTEFSNNYSWNYRASFNPQTVSRSRTRGGPLMLNKPGYEIGTYWDTDGKSKLFYFIEAGTYFQPEAGSWNGSFYPGIEWKPVSNVYLRLGPGIERSTEDAQYVGTWGDPTATGTYGNRYVFGVLDQTQISGNIRFNVSFTPNVSLQLFMQPLIARGDYHGFKALSRQRSYDFLEFGEDGSTYNEAGGIGTADPDGSGPAAPIEIENPDFNFKSLRGNAVFRWEYRPGSTLFLVWTQNRVDEEVLGDLQFNRSVRRLFDRQPEDIFLAKVTYYLGL